MALLVYSMAGCASMSSQVTPLVEFRRSGGITGRDERLVVRSDGTVQLSRRGAVAEFRIGGDTLARIRELLGSVNFARLRAEYLPPRPGADLFEYVVVYKDRTIRTMDTAVPAELAPLIQLLSGVANRRT